MTVHATGTSLTDVKAGSCSIRVGVRDAILDAVGGNEVVIAAKEMCQ